MRLTNFEIDAIKTTFKTIFIDGEIYLFGSRIDDYARGGDIDLFIISENANLEKKIDFLVNIKDKIGDQKIDVIISKDPTRLIEREALKKGIKL